MGASSTSAKAVSENKFPFFRWNLALLTKMEMARDYEDGAVCFLVGMCLGIIRWNQYNLQGDQDIQWIPMMKSQRMKLDLNEMNALGLRPIPRT